MLHIAVQVKELVSSNLNTLVATATDPAKMLGLLQRQLQDCIVTLQGDLSRARRQHERLLAEAARLDSEAAEWTDKAQVAMNHKREDLARAALLTRERTLADAAKTREAAQAATAEAEETAQALAQLEAKLSETDARLADERASAPAARAPRAAPTSASSSGSRSERMLDRIATLEKRVDFAAGDEPQPSPISIDAEIAQLEREAKVSEELAAMKAAAKPAGKGKGKAGR